MSCFLHLKKYLDLNEELSYFLRNAVVDACLHVLSTCCIINLENTLQASPMVRRRDAQTGGFIISGGCYAL